MCYHVATYTMSVHFPLLLSFLLLTRNPAPSGIRSMWEARASLDSRMLSLPRWYLDLDAAAEDDSTW